MAEQKQSILIKCPSLICGKVLSVPVTARGKTIRCRSCGSTVRVPTDAPAQKAG